MAPAPPAPSESRKRRPSQPDPWMFDGFSGPAPVPACGPPRGSVCSSEGSNPVSPSSATVSFTRTCGTPWIHSTRCHAALVRSEGSYSAGLKQKTSNDGAVGDPGTRRGALSSTTQCCRKSVPSTPTSPPPADGSEPTGGGGVLSAAASDCSMYTGAGTLTHPAEMVVPRLIAPLSAAAETPTTDSSPNAGMPRRSATEGSIANPAQDVSRTNQPGDA
mmetsp:Transcript_5271/g.21562  ORF Transcript_5271/g.21562 Transcript_5271/m.21562 type:complete len:218 (-) Transcript_5271:567-1220(-)